MRVLILRTSALGDVVHALPALSALARHLPDAEVGWAVEEAYALLRDWAVEKGRPDPGEPPK